MSKVNVPKKTAKQDEVVFDDSESVTEKVLPIIEEEPVEVVKELEVKDIPQVVNKKTDKEKSVKADLEVSVKNPPMQNVRIATNKDHTCSIGGTRYVFFEGVQQNVSTEVKEILKTAGFLAPL